MNKNIEKLLNVIMYFSTISGYSWNPQDQRALTVVIPIKITFTRKNRRKTYNFNLRIKQSTYKKSSIFCSLQIKNTYVFQMYECTNQYERSICSDRSFDVVLQNAYTCDEWALATTKKSNNEQVEGINLLSLSEEEYFQYSLLYDLPEYEEMLKFEKCVDVMNDFYEKYKKKYSQSKMKEFSRLMFLDCKRIFLRYIENDISFDIPLDVSLYQELIYRTNFDFTEFKSIIEDRK